jgi:hypothetical protein
LFPVDPKYLWIFLTENCFACYFVFVVDNFHLVSHKLRVSAEPTKNNC